MSRSILLAIWASVVRLIFVFYFVYAFYSYSFGGAKYLRFIMTFDFQVSFKAKDELKFEKRPSLKDF